MVTKNRPLTIGVFVRLCFLTFCFFLSACAGVTKNSSVEATEPADRAPGSAQATDVSQMETLLRCTSLPGVRTQFVVGKANGQIYIYSPSNHFVDEINDEPNIGFATENGIQKGFIKSDRLQTGKFVFIRKNEKERTEEWALSFTRQGISFREGADLKIPFYDVRVMLADPQMGPSKVFMQSGSQRFETHICCIPPYAPQTVNNYPTCLKSDGSKN